MKKSILLEKSFRFALMIIQMCKNLELNRDYNFSNQVFRSGTSIGANVREAQQPESRADFIHKLKVAMKEAEETQYWLELLRESENVAYDELILSEVTQLKLIISKSIATAKRNHSKKRQAYRENSNT